MNIRLLKVAALFIMLLTPNKPVYSQTAENIGKNTKLSSLKNTLADSQLFEVFLQENLTIIKFKNAQEVQYILSNMADTFFFGTLLKENIFMSELIFRLTNSKKALPKLFSIITKPDKFIIFSIFIILTIIISTLVSEFQYLFKRISLKRSSFALLKHTSINIIRLWGFFYIFGAHLYPSIDVYLDTVASTKEIYPLFYKVNFILTMLF